MSAKTMSSLTDENRELRKQIGCMNGIFQVFDRHHFLTGRRISSHNHKRPLQGGQQHQLDSLHGKKAVMEKGLDQQKEKPRISTDSSRASCSSSSCSSTFSSLDFNRIAQPETLPLRQINILEIPFQTTATKEQQPPLTKAIPSLELRDVVKDSMYREACGVSIKSIPNDERRGTVMKHIDSPRPSQPSNSVKPKANSHEGSTRVLAKNERLVLPRFSFDGRESRETFKSTMKHKELPRLSLDSRTSSIKRSTLESRLSFPGHTKNENSSQVLPLYHESGSQNRTSSVVARLMGLEAFPDAIPIEDSTIKSCPKEVFLSQLTSRAEENKQNQVTYSPRVSQNNLTSTSPRLQSPNFGRKPTTSSRFPVEPAPWRQQDPSQGSPRTASQSRKAPGNTPPLSPSVYGEIEKRIMELEFRKSGKDLRALKQILEAMQKKRARLADHRGESTELTLQRSLENTRSDLNSDSSMQKNRKSRQENPTKYSGSSLLMNPAKVIDKVKLSGSTRTPKMEIPPHLQRLQTGINKENSAHGQKLKDLRAKNNNGKEFSRNFTSIDKATSWRTSELNRTLASPQIENLTNPGKNFGMVSPRLQQNLLKIEGQSRPTTPTSDLGRVKSHCNKKLNKVGLQNSKQKIKTNDLQLSDDQLSELSSHQGDTASVKSESNSSQISQMERDVISLAHSINTKSGHKENFISTPREYMPAVEIAATMLEQPSPISVLDDTFYCEDSPSPVKKISTAFQDEGPNPDEAEWHLENLDCVMDSTRSNHAFQYDKKLEITKNSVHELTVFEHQRDETAAHQNALVYGSLNPDHRYINKILLTSGLLKDSSFISTSDQLLPSRHLINPEMFNVLEQTEEIMEGVNVCAIEKKDRTMLNKKIQRKIIFDMVDEILVRKITSGRLFTMVKKRTSPQGLLKELYLEMDRVCSTPACNFENDEDEMIRLLSEDMKYQSEDWTDYSGEVPALVLDIERLIFKDLINEVVTGEVLGLHDGAKMLCRKLFSK